MSPDLASGNVSRGATGNIATVTLTRPAAMNAISNAMAEELRTAFEDVAEDEDAWVVILRAEGDKAFCVGADLKERGSFTLEDFYANRERIRSMFTALREVPQPVIASVFGFALGGGFELALSCDLMIVADDVTLGLPETRVGLIPAGGGTQLLTRKVGAARAKDLILRSRRFDARTAREMGLVSSVVPRDRLDKETHELALELCKSSPVANRAAKSAIDHALGLPLEDGIEAEHEGWATVIESEDRLEGIAAFNEKRDPRWNNR
ncbi:MAG TPA: enoyl-CoA hydratase-related protein [Actinomycetota bacterium]|nr:enoyl-CoA hydratase-related protein [Actinomycetota bacterium]